MKILQKLFGLGETSAIAPKSSPVAPTPEAEPPGPKDWTVLVYGNGNSQDLEFSIASGIHSLARLGQSSKVAFAAQLASYSDGGQAQRLTLEESAEKVEQNLGPTNMGDGQTLSDFLAWGIKKYPAKHYMVILSGHGGAYRGGYPDDRASDHLDLTEIENSFETARQVAGQKLDVLVHSACFMACAEAVQAVSESVDYVVASEAVSTTECPNLWTLGGRLQYECRGEVVSSQRAAELALESNDRITVNSIVRPAQLKEVVPQIRRLAEALVETTQDSTVVGNIIKGATNFGGPLEDIEASPAYTSVRDLASLAHQLANAPEILDPEIKLAASEVEEAFWGSKLVVAGTKAPDSSIQGARGLSIWAPIGEADSTAVESYQKTSFAQVSGWGKVVQRYGQLND